jgi:hypothetical protein
VVRLGIAKPDEAPNFPVRDGMMVGVGYCHEEGGQQITEVLKEFT